MSKKILILLVLTLISLIVMRILDAPLKNEIAPNGIVSFELAKNLNNSIDIINSWDYKSKLYAGLSLGFDYLFMLLYSFLFYILIKNISEKLTNIIFAKIGLFIAYSMIFAGIFDAIENYSLIRLYLGNLDQIYASLAFYFASLKFALLLIGVIYLIYFNFHKLVFDKK